MIYVALDVPTTDEAIAIVDELAPENRFVKVGMELYYRGGNELVQVLQEKGCRIFLDVKMTDIPNTVYKATKQLAQLHVDFITICANGGVEMMKRAREAVEEVQGENPTTKLLAVTLLTSMEENMLRETFQTELSPEEWVAHQTRLAKQAGVGGIVCSVWESDRVRALYPEATIVTPGIRLQADASHDQKRVATPEEAGRRESDHLVVGRSITGKLNRNEAYETMLEAFEQGRGVRS
ncbi:orotidine-5'-phosphate decarboxylase [Bacillus fonticola]|uniref:orotidine-5'-phosphate decarboxylase n=1 Tax=Bacillus fonticola TaxID=2728853 RepID=UPI001473B0B2|nr:orotidine-5'-phosphate decarboxylase [Bacillus fonticola]